MSDEDDFNWSDVKDDLVVEWQGAIAVYRNAAGGVVIRQQGEGSGDDQFVVIQPRHMNVLIRKMRAVAATIKATE